MNSPRSVCLRGILCVCYVSRWLAAGCGVCLFCVVAVFVQRASGCAVRLSGRGKLCGVCAGLCAPGRVRGRSGVRGMRSAPEGGVCLSRAAGVLGSRGGSPGRVAGAGGAFRLGAGLVTRTRSPMKY